MNGKFPQIHIIYNRYKKASPTQKAVVEIRISYNYRQKYISTGIWLYPNQWKDGKIVNCENIFQISQILDRLVSNVRTVLMEMMEEGNIDIFAVPSRLAGDDFDDMSFLHFCKKRMKIRKYGKNKDTQERYDRFYKHFKNWGKIRKFEDLTSENIIVYDKHLQKKGMLPQSKWHNYHRFLSSFVRDAVDEGLVSKNPYKWVNIDKGEKGNGIEKCLTMKEFRQLKKAAMPTECLERVKDLFIFQTYTCLRYSDLALFDTKYIKDIKDMKVYIRKSKKTKKEFVVPILPFAWSILMKYNGTLPIISNPKYNLYLKAVSQAAGLDKPLSTHWARHTGATLLLNEGVDVEIIAKVLGDTTKQVRTTYAKMLDETVMKAVKEVEKKL